MKTIAALIAAAAFGWAGMGYAKLPAPTDGEKAKAAEAKAKAEENAKKAAANLAREQDRAVENFKRTRAAKH
jgi:hypothetical protein